MEFNVSAPKLLKLLLSIISFLLLANLFAIFSKYYFDFPGRFQLELLFHFDAEESFPTFFNTLLLLFSSWLFYVISRIKINENAPFRYHWLALAAIFIFLAADETLSFHERVNTILQDHYHTSGYLYHVWAIPYGIAAILIGLIFIKFLLHLPSKNRWLMVLAGAFYVGGAVGIEIFEGAYFDKNGEDIVFDLFITVEELFEMLGLSLLIYSLSDYLNNILSPKGSSIALNFR